VNATLTTTQRAQHLAARVAAAEQHLRADACSAGRREWLGECGDAAPAWDRVHFDKTPLRTVVTAARGHEVQCVGELWL
jgi:hypothetical protein